jgi:hypothetical protein
MKFSDRTRKKRPLNTGDRLIEVTAWAGLTVNIKKAWAIIQTTGGKDVNRFGSRNLHYG